MNDCGHYGVMMQAGQQLEQMAVAMRQAVREIAEGKHDQARDRLTKSLFELDRS